MAIAGKHDPKSDIGGLEAAAESARSGFACMFSTSDEYEHALIAARRAEGRYKPSSDRQSTLLIGGIVVLLGILLTVV